MPTENFSRPSKEHSRDSTQFFSENLRQIGVRVPYYFEHMKIQKTGLPRRSCECAVVDDEELLTEPRIKYS